MKRALDITLALIIGVILVIPVTGMLIWLARGQGRPFLYGAERMKTAERGFTLWKFRTMTADAEDSGVSGGDKKARITAQGATMRRYRADEIPQLWNVLKGDISLVGPRPPLREYVESYPELYAEVLRSKPGITGLASLTYASHEEKLLSRATNKMETDTIYRAHCVPMKAKLDLIYQRNCSFCYDLKLIWQTAKRFTPDWFGRRS
ncbi:MAG: sugar transferase [Rhodobacteraceae bacterium]|nr:sugar transferase [Paracoccaceae bacterium]